MIRIDFDTFAKEVLSEIGTILVKQGKANMNKTSFGRVYIIGGKRHIASKAGDTANNQSGALNETIHFEISGTILEFGAGDKKVNYAKFLELGTNRMDKRPNYTKSILQSKTKIDIAIAQSIAKNMRWTV